MWLDPTVFTTQPLDAWIDDQMSAGVFFFSNPGRDRLISNWFIAAEPQNLLLSRLYDQLCAYWEKNTFRNIGRQATNTEQVMFRAINRDIRLTRLWFSWPFRRLIRISPYMVYHYMVADIVNRDDAAAAVYSRMSVFSAKGPHALQRKGCYRTLMPRLRKSWPTRIFPCTSLLGNSQKMVCQSKVSSRILSKWRTSETLLAYWHRENRQLLSSNDLRAQPRYIGKRRHLVSRCGKTRSQVNVQGWNLSWECRRSFSDYTC